MPADKVSFYNCIDMGIFICFMDICLWNNGVGFEKTLYSDAGDDDKELVLNAKYRILICDENRTLVHIPRIAGAE